MIKRVLKFLLMGVYTLVVALLLGWGFVVSWQLGIANFSLWGVMAANAYIGWRVMRQVTNQKVRDFLVFPAQIGLSFGLVTLIWALLDPRHVGGIAPFDATLAVIVGATSSVAVVLLWSIWRLFRQPNRRA